jgi:hypothetical protein
VISAIASVMTPPTANVTNARLENTSDIIRAALTTMRLSARRVANTDSRQHDQRRETTNAAPYCPPQSGHQRAPTKIPTDAK